MITSGYPIVLGALDPGEGVATPPPWPLRDRLEPGEALPESLEDGRETEVGPSLGDLRPDVDREPADERDRDRGGLIAGGGSGGGALGTIGS